MGFVGFGGCGWLVFWVLLVVCDWCCTAVFCGVIWWWFGLGIGND